MLYTANTMHSIAQKEVEEIKKELKYNYQNIILYRHLKFGKLLMLLQLGLITTDEYYEIRDLFDKGNETLIKDEITNGGF